MSNVLFVCTANLIRSPFAAGIFRKLVQEDQGKWDVDSAGTWAKNNLRPSDYLVDIASNWDVDFSSHRSKEISEDLLEISSLVLVMELGQKESLVYEFPAFAQRIRVMSEEPRGAGRWMSEQHGENN